MITEKQYRRLLMSVKKEKNVSILADKCGMNEKSARKYLKSNKPPSEMKKPHTWRTHDDMFNEVWDEALKYLELNGGLEAKSLFEYLQKEYPEKYSDGQLRTFQRKVKLWKITEGPSQEVFFSQKHYPGQLCAIDYTHMDELDITIRGVMFNHLIFHFVLTYSNWETGNICYSESLESLSEGLQRALWDLGGVPEKIRSDNLTAATHKELNRKVFTDRYQSLLNHYGLNGSTINAGKPNENGDVEQRNYRFKKAVKQALILRGSSEFTSLEEYEKFLKKLFSQLNLGRKKRFSEEIKLLKSLPKTKLDNFKTMYYKVGASSTLSISHNTYSIDSRLIGSRVKVILKANTIAIYYGSKKNDEFPRLRGTGKHKINYRHFIDSLQRKPGAFENYKYRDDFFPTIQFRLAYDYFKKYAPLKASKQYIALLVLAVNEGENLIDRALIQLFNKGQEITLSNVQNILKTSTSTSTDTPEVTVADIDLKIYDQLLTTQEGLYG